MRVINVFNNLFEINAINSLKPIIIGYYYLQSCLVSVIFISFLGRENPFLELKSISNTELGNERSIKIQKYWHFCPR